MTKDSSFYTRAGLPFGPEGPESPKDPKIFLDSDGRSIFLRKDLEKNLKKDPVYRYIDLGYLDDVEGGDKTLTINIPGSKNILSRFSLSGSQKQPKLEEGDFSEIAISLNYQKVTCLAIKEISATKILHLISALANIREPSSLKKIDLSQISIRNLPTDVVSIMPEVMVGIARIKSVDSLALCRISYDKKSKEKSSETTSLDGSYFEDHFPSSKSIIDVEYLPKQEGIKERSHIKLFENQMSHLEGLFEYRHDSMDEDKKGWRS